MNTKKVLFGFTAVLVFCASMVLVGCDDGSSPVKPDSKNFTVTFNANGGTVTPTTDTTGADSTLSNLPVPAKDGYTFNGWYTAIDGGDIVTTSTKFSSNAAIYASWTEENSNTNNTFTDSRDDKTYRIVTIGEQTWMAENLNYAGLGNNVGVCYDNSSDSCEKYGRLYTWAEAMAIGEEYNTTRFDGSADNHQGICPDDWHLPSNDEWGALRNYVGGAGTGTKLKSQEGWDNNGNGTDDYEFSALPGGVRWSDGSFDYAGTSGYWWTATEFNAPEATGRNILSSSAIFGEWYNKDRAHSVRCVKD